MWYILCMPDPIELMKRDPNVSQPFRDAIQFPLPHWTFRALTRDEKADDAAMGRGLSADLADYMTGGRETR
jgi:hypothetical protein